MKPLLIITFLCAGLATVNAQPDTTQHAQVDSLVRLSKAVINNDVDKGDSLAQEALRLAIRSGYAVGEANALSQLGIAHFHRGNNKEAIRQYLEALKVYDREKLAHDFQYGLIMVRLAAIFNYEKDWSHNRYYLQQAEAIGLRNNDQQLLAITYAEWATTQTVLQNFDSAFYYYKAALKILETTDNKLQVANIYANIGVNYFYMERYEDAISYYKKGLAYNRQLGRTMQASNGLYNIGEAYFYLKSYHPAITYLDSAYRVAKNAGLLGGIQDIYLMKARSYGALKNTDSSAHYFEKVISVKDSVYNDAYHKELASLQTTLDVYKSETENKLLKQDNRIATLYRNLAIAGIIALIAVLAFVLTRQRLKIQRTIKEKLEEEVRLRTAEILQANEEISTKNTALAESNETKTKLVAALEEVNLKLQLSLNRAKVDPHFIFNILNSIQHIVLEKKPHEALDHLAKLSRLMRYVLEKSSLEIVTLQEEVTMLEQYIQLEQLRLDDKFQYQINVQGMDSTKVPAMLIQPYVENAILHGLSPATGTGLSLKLFFEKAGEMLRIIIEDNGVGRTFTERKGHTSLGSTLGQKRLDILSKLEQKIFSVKIEDLTWEGRAAGTKVIMEIPLTIQHA